MQGKEDRENVHAMGRLRRAQLSRNSSSLKAALSAAGSTLLLSAQSAPQIWLSASNVVGVELASQQTRQAQCRLHV
jgi:hypothetical protein